MRRIQRDSSHEELIKMLTSGEQPIFREIWRVLLFASSVGIAHGKRKQLQNIDSGKSMPESYFSAAGWPGFLHLLGIAETGSSDILRTDEKNREYVATLFEEYANAGLEIIEEKIRNASTPLDAIILLMSESDKREASLPTVTELI